MLLSKKITLKPLLESTEGVHLTAYLVNRGKLHDLKDQLQEAINQSYEWLNPVMTIEKRDRFLRPLNALMDDTSIFNRMKGNIGIFRSENFFRILNIPVDVEQMCNVATSFHVKPLLRWLQTDREFLLLGIEKEAAHLYFGNQDSLKLVDSILFPESFKHKYSAGSYLSMAKARLRNLKEDETFTWLSEWIAELTKTSKPKLFVAGEKSIVRSLNRSLKYENVAQSPVANEFSKNNISDICSAARAILKDESRASLEKSLMEFRFAEEKNLTQKNIFQISKAVVKGRVRSLLVSEELSIFGKI